MRYPTRTRRRPSRFAMLLGLALVAATFAACGSDTKGPLENVTDADRARGKEMATTFQQLGVRYDRFLAAFTDGKLDAARTSLDVTYASLANARAQVDALQTDRARRPFARYIDVTEDHIDAADRWLGYYETAQVQDVATESRLRAEFDATGRRLQREGRAMREAVLASAPEGERDQLRRNMNAFGSESTP